MKDSDPQMKQFNDTISRITEQYGDYFIAVRCKGGGLIWKASDAAWALGCCHRFTLSQDEQDRFTEVEDMMNDDEDGLT